jgi:hypothetical protein
LEFAMPITRLDDPNEAFDAVRGPDMHSETILVTPEIAASWLTRNHPENRPVSARYVARVVWDLQRGNWDLTHESIAFDQDDRLIDGQHRLSAVVKSGASVPMRVSFNVRVGYGANINGGRSRSAADMLRRSPRETAIAKALVHLETRERAAPSMHKVAETCAAYGAELTWARKALPIHRGVTAHVVAAFVYALPAAKVKVTTFAKDFVDHVGADASVPTAVLRRYLERGHHSTARLDFALVSLRCLQAHCEKESLHRLVATEQGFEYFKALRASRGL